MPTNDLKFFSLSFSDYLKYVTSNCAAIRSTIVTYFFEVTIFEPLLRKTHTTQNRRPQPLFQRSQSLLCELPDAHSKFDSLTRRSPNQPLNKSATYPELYSTFCGLLSFNGAGLSGIGQEIVPTIHLEFDFLSSNYAVEDVDFDSYPNVVFLNGKFLGLSFMSKSFSFVEGLSKLEESYFVYELERSSGAGDINYHLLLPHAATVASKYN